MVASIKLWKWISFVSLISLIFVTYKLIQSKQTTKTLAFQVQTYKELNSRLQTQHRFDDNHESVSGLSNKPIQLSNKKESTDDQSEKKEPYLSEGLLKLKNMPTNNMADVEYRYYNTTYYRDGQCGPESKYYGPANDGGYTICLSGNYKFKKGDCIVYDFGINNIWQFDDEIVKEHNCHLYAFDPTMRVKDHQRGHNINFYQMGISGLKNDTRWRRVKTLKGIMEYLNHTNTIIDLMKFDVEWSEWDLLETIMREDSFKNIKQIIFESHVNFNKETFENFLKRANILIELRKTGMRQWHHRDNQVKTNIKQSRYTPFQRNCCIEHSMINVNFQD